MHFIYYIYLFFRFCCHSHLITKHVSSSNNDPCSWSEDPPIGCPVFAVLVQWSAQHQYILEELGQAANAVVQDLPVMQTRQVDNGCQHVQDLWMSRQPTEVYKWLRPKDEFGHTVCLCLFVMNSAIRFVCVYLLWIRPYGLFVFICYEFGHTVCLCLFVMNSAI